MDTDDQVPETRGVTSELVSIMDLGPEIEAMDGYQLRMRMFTFAPGAVFGPRHDHVGRHALQPGHEHPPGCEKVAGNIGGVADRCGGEGRHDFGSTQMLR